MVRPRYVINPTNPNRKKVLRSAFTSKVKTSIIKKDLGGEASLVRVLKSGKGFVYNILWILLIFVSTLTCCYQTYDRLNFFLSRPVENRVTLIRNSSVKFPSITLCPTQNNYVPLTGLRIQKQKELKIYFCWISPFKLLNDTTNITAIWDLMSVTGTFYAYEYSLSKLQVYSTGFKQNSFSVKTDTKTVFGTCHTYSYENLLEFRREDFQLVFVSQPGLALCDPTRFHAFMLHNDDDIVTYKAFRDSKVLFPLSTLTYGVSAKRFKILNRSVKPCGTDRVVNECEINCFENALKNISPCRLPMTSNPEMPLCASENDSTVAWDQLKSLALNFNYLKNCNCPKVCDEILYTTHFQMIQPNKLPALAIYFDDDVIEEIEEYYCYSFISFICDFGGNLGLFLGLSVPAVFQLADSIIVHTIMNTNLKK